MRIARADGCQGPVDIPHPTAGVIDPFPMRDYNCPLCSPRSINGSAEGREHPPLASLVRMWIVDVNQIPPATHK